MVCVRARVYVSVTPHQNNRMVSEQANTRLFDG